MYAYLYKILKDLTNELNLHLSFSVRPVSGSLSRYSVLPSIGTKAAEPPPSPPSMVERSITMLKLNNDVQIMKLDDDDDEGENLQRSLNQSRRNSKPMVPVYGIQREKSLAENALKKIQSPVLVDKDSSVEHSLKDEALQTENSPPTLQKEHSVEEPVQDVSPEFRPLTRENTLSEEPKGDEETVLLAVKLPDGQRVSRRFRQDETMGMVMHFAEVSSQLDLSGYDLVCDAPRKVYKDLNITVGESGLATRTVLHIRFPDA